MIISLGDDSFRLPKQLAMYGVTIVASGVFVIALLLRAPLLDESLRRNMRLPSSIAAAGIFWAVVTTLTSQNRLLSTEALIWGACLTAVLLIGAVALRSASLDVVATAVLAPAIANSTLLLLQATQLWNPWVFAEGEALRPRRNAFLGNVDDVGVYLAATALFANALVLTTRRGRPLYVFISCYLAAALLATETLTGIAAYVVGLVFLLILKSRRLGMTALAAAPVVLSIVLFMGPTGSRMAGLIKKIEAGEWGQVVTGRLVPFGTAYRMFLQHPISGGGPGTFKYQYMKYFTALSDDHPEFFALSRTAAVNFAETHNDHLQILAEMGLPGYIIILAGFIVIGLRSHRPISRDDRHEVARILAAPLVALTLTAMLAQFPLQIAATAYTSAVLGAICLAWTSRNVA